MEKALTNSLVYLMGPLSSMERPVLLASSFLFAKKGFIIARTSSATVEEIFHITPSGNKAQDSAIQDIFHYVLPLYQQLFKNSRKAFEDFLFALKAMNWNDFRSEDFDEMLLGVIGSLGKASAEFAQPKEVTELVTKLLDYKGGRVYNPFAGIGSYGIKLNIGNDYFAEELVQQVWVVGVARLILNDTFSENYVIDNSFNTRPTKIDYVVATPPWQMRIADQMKGCNINAKTSDDFLWKNAIRCLNDNGICVSVHASGISYNELYSTARAELVDNNYLDAIISLPRNVFFGTSINTVIIVLKKGRRHNEPIKLLNASDSRFYFEQRPRAILNVKRILDEYNYPEDTEFITHVSTEDIISHDYSFVVEDYFEVHLNDDASDVFSSYTSYRVANLCSIADIFPESLPEVGREVKASDLSDNPFYIFRNPEDIKECILRKEQKYRRIDRPALVISTRFSLKTAYINASPEEPVYIPTGYLSVYPNELIDYRFFAYQLDRIKKSLFRGAAMQSLSMKGFWDSLIPCPPIEEQITLYDEFSRQYKINKARELGFEDLLDEKKRVYKTLIRQRKHNMKTPLTEIFNTWKMLNLLVNDSPDMPEMEKLVKLKKYVAKQDISIKDLQKQLNHLTDENKFDEAQGLFDIYAFLKQREFSSEKYCIECDMDAAQLEQFELRPVSKVTEDALIEVFNNIISNAIVHGFNNFKNFEEHGQYHIYVHLGAEVSERGSQLKIDFINDGKPFPSGFTKEDYGRDGATAGENGGEGHGGSYVKEMVEFYGGDYEIGNIDEGLSTHTFISIYLPTPQIDNYDTGR